MRAGMEIWDFWMPKMSDIGQPPRFSAIFLDVIAWLAPNPVVAHSPTHSALLALKIWPLTFAKGRVSP